MGEAGRAKVLGQNKRKLVTKCRLLLDEASLIFAEQGAGQII